MRRLLKTPGRFCDMVVLFSGHLGSTVACLTARPNLATKAEKDFGLILAASCSFTRHWLQVSVPNTDWRSKVAKMRFEVESAQSVGGSLGSR
jgi:hypothetical protein